MTKTDDKPRHATNIIRGGEDQGSGKGVFYPINYKAVQLD